MIANASPCGLWKMRLEHPDDEVLRGVVVVVQQHPPHARLLELLVAARLGERRFVACRGCGSR